MDDKKSDSPLLYNSRIFDTYIKLIRRRYSFVNIHELLAYAGMTVHEVADQGHWFSQDQANRFHEQLAHLTGNPHIAREAGRYAASPDASGVMRQFFLGLLGPAKSYELIERGSVNFTRSSEYKSRKLKKNKVVITVTPLPGTHEQPFQCENRTGYFEAIAMIFDSKAPKIEHPECIFRGGDCCRYVVSWEKSLSAIWSRIRAAFVAAGILTFLFLGITNQPLAYNYMLPAMAFTVVILTMITQKIERLELNKSQNNLLDSTEKLIEQININYNNALMANEIGHVISKETKIDGILGSVTQVLQKRLDYDRGLILMANEDRTKLIYRTGFGYSDDQLKTLWKTTFRLDRPESKGIFIVCFKEQKPYLINNINEIEDHLSLRSLNFAKKMGAQSFVCCPIICEGESLGVLAVDNMNSKRPLVQSDMSLLMGIAPVIGISIRNAYLLETRTRQFTSLLQVMAASIDARDPLTAGHSEKVTQYAMGICEELELPEEYREMVRVAAMLHDYGKIGVPDAILKKNGALTETEYEVVKTHTYKTRDILGQIHFEGIYRHVPAVAGAHHEKINGSGYPQGLKGRDIPLGAKIIAVADFFDAITSQRHYRDPMPLEEAFRLLKEGSGTHFEKKVVDALIEHYQKGKLHSGLTAVND